MSETETTTAQELERTIQYPVALAFINDLATEYMPLKIDGILDKDGQTVVKKARLDVKKHRVAVEHKRKALKADALDYGRKVDSAAKLLTSELLKIEDHLIAEETAVKDEIARITREEEERKQVVLQDRLDKLWAVECKARHDVGAMSDNEFAETLAKATEHYKAQKAEEAKQEHEAEEAKREHEAEDERLAAERKKLEEEKAELEIEKAEIEAEKQRVENERVEAVRKVAEEKQREEEVEAEQERQKRLEAMRPDIEKLARIADTLDTIRVPKVVSVDAEPKRQQVLGVLVLAATQIRKITAE